MNHRPAFSAQIRRVGAEALDRARGGKMKRLLQQIDADMNTGAAQGGSGSDPALRRILHHASTTTAAYSELVGAPLKDYPVIDKFFVREHTDALLSHSYDAAELTQTSTSGSTGAPLYVYQDKRKSRHRSAEALYFTAQAGYQPGMPLFYVKVWSERNRKSAISAALRNIRPISVTHFNDEEQERLLREIGAARQPVAVIAYASALELIARALETRRVPPPDNVATIVSQSEALTPQARTVLTSRLNAPVLERYGNEEVGIIAQQWARHDTRYRINTHSVHLEILDMDSDRPASPGSLGRIVVTDLQNRGMPLIRYDTGDVGRFPLHPDGTPERHFLAEVQGRTLDQIYDNDDRAVSPHLFANFFWKYPELVQAQVEQTAKGKYILRANAPSLQSVDRIVDELRAILGQSSVICVERVSEIPVLRSGKRRPVVSRYRPN